MCQTCMGRTKIWKIDAEGDGVVGKRSDKMEKKRNGGKGALVGYAGLSLIWRRRN